MRFEVCTVIDGRCSWGTYLNSAVNDPRFHEECENALRPGPEPTDLQVLSNKQSMSPVALSLHLFPGALSSF